MIELFEWFFLERKFENSMFLNEKDIIKIKREPTAIKLKLKRFSIEKNKNI